jgi:hypothetical protein
MIERSKTTTEIIYRKEFLQNFFMVLTELKKPIVRFVLLYRLNCNTFDMRSHVINEGSDVENHLKNLVEYDTYLEEFVCGKNQATVGAIEGLVNNENFRTH